MRQRRADVACRPLDEHTVRTVGELSAGRGRRRLAAHANKGATRAVRHRAPPGECTCLANPDADAVLMNLLARAAAQRCEAASTGTTSPNKVCSETHSSTHRCSMGRRADDATHSYAHKAREHTVCEDRKRGHADVSAWAQPRTTRQGAQRHDRWIRLIAPRR